MALDTCDPCCDPSSVSRGLESYRQGVLTTLCSIAAGTGGFPSPNAGWDYLKVTYPNATTEVYTFRSGGAGGDIVGVTTIVYTDATKEFIDTVTNTNP